MADPIPETTTEVSPETTTTVDPLAALDADKGLLNADAPKAEDKPVEGEAPVEEAAADADAEKPANGDAETPAEEADPDAVVPEGAYQVKLDAEKFGDMEVSTEALAEAEPILKEAGVTQAQLNKLMPTVAGLVKDAVEKTATVAQQAVIDDVLATRKAWAEATAADPEIGGSAARVDEVRSVAAKALDAFGGPQFRAFLADTGLDRHPDMVRFAYRAGVSIKESEFYSAETPTQEVKVERAHKFYGEEYRPKP